MNPPVRRGVERPVADVADGSTDNIASGAAHAIAAGTAQRIAKRSTNKIAERIAGDIVARRGDREIRFGQGLTVIEGPNGCGKTSLLRSLAGLPSALPWSINGKAPIALPTRRGRPANAPNGPASAANAPNGPADPTIDPSNVSANAADASAPTRVRFAMQRARDSLVGLTLDGERRLRGVAWGAAEHLIGPLSGERVLARLSGGETRRVSLAGAIAAIGPNDLLLLDEPLEGLSGALQLPSARIIAVDQTGTLAKQANRVVTLAPVSRSSWPIFRSTSVPRSVHAGPPKATLQALGPGLHVLWGPNGCGKSTFLWKLASEGRILPQDPLLALLCEQVGDRIEADFANPILPPHLLDRHPMHLSGGEVQRAALAAVLGVPAPVYLLDEPDAHLDANGRLALAAAMAQRIAEGSCVLVATHDQGLAAAATTVMHMEAP